MRKDLLLTTIFLIVTFPLFGFDLPVARITDDSLLRRRIMETWLTDVPARVLARRPSIEVLETGERVRLSTIQGREEFRVVIARELVRGTSVQNRRITGQYPGWAQGSWMITRNRSTGEGRQIRIFLRSDEHTHIQFNRLSEDRCSLDVIIYGAFIARAIVIPVPFERLYTMSTNDILRLVEDKFPMRYFEPKADDYRDTREFIEQVRSRLGNLRFRDDGALNENNEYVFIETLQRQPFAVPGLNCSGFVKWLVDGLCRPITGARLTIPPLKQPFVDRTATAVAWAEALDFYFGLDWNRNLAAHANTILRSSAYAVLEEFEIRRANFSQLIVPQDNTYVVHSYPGFLHEAGFGIEGLHPLLYTLAIDEPYSFYLGALNREMSNPANPRDAVRMRQYYHLAALVPYFDENGDFRIVVFESAAETQFTGFLRRQRSRHINLVKIPVAVRFDP